MILPKSVLVMAMLLPFWGIANAEVTPDEGTSQRVIEVTERLFNQLPNEDFEKERTFMSTKFAETMPLEKWQGMRQETIEVMGRTPRFVAHALTYYERENLIAAVDFSGLAGKPDTAVCGYILWEIADEETIGFFRFEQNIVSIPLFQEMPAEEAAQLMANWRCPRKLIEAVLRADSE